VIRCVVNPGCTLGEGPLWDAETQRLYWVDILENRIYRHDPSAGTTESWRTPEHVGFVLPFDGGLVAGFASGLHHVELRDDGSVTATRIDHVDPKARFNDATRDREGRIWACTLAAYYCYDPELNRRTVDEGYLVANGPALSPDGGLLYTVETSGHPGRRRGIYVARIEADGTLAGQRLLVDWEAYASAPDGVVTDDDGNLWLGEFRGNVLRRFSPDGKETLAVPLPAWNVTKAALAADRLYVTSARVETDEETLARYPETGAVLEVVLDA
jgi:sugar lactone lactonase YvrE